MWMDPFLLGPVKTAKSRNMFEKGLVFLFFLVLFRNVKKLKSGKDVEKLNKCDAQKNLLYWQSKKKTWKKKKWKDKKNNPNFCTSKTWMHKG